MEDLSRLIFSCFDCSEGEIRVIPESDSIKVSDCPICGACYRFDSATEIKISKFVDLYKQIGMSADILGDASIVISTEHGSIEVSFNLLLTRFPAVLRLKVEGKELVLRFVFDAIEKACIYREPCESSVTGH
ncbi:MAG: hypothetical protein RSB82_03320 [Victivallaceae bacterium]